jgi:formyl-CoA transferase
MKAIDRHDLAENPELQSNDGRVQASQMIDDAIAEWTERHTIGEVLQILEKAAVPSGPIYTAADICQDPQYRARGMIEKHRLPDGHAIEIPGIVPKLSQTPGETAWLGPALGAHTEEILSSIGIGKSEFQRLHAEGVI